MCKRSENSENGQLTTILEKELVTGSEREELGLPSAKSSSCPLTVLIRAAGNREKQAQKKGEKGEELKPLAGVGVGFPRHVWVGTANQELAGPSLASPEQQQ